MRLRDHLRMEITASSRCRCTSPPAARPAPRIRPRPRPRAITPAMVSVDRLHVRDADFPALLHRDLDHLVQLGIADIAFRVHAMDGGQQLAQAGGRRAAAWPRSPWPRPRPRPSGCARRPRGSPSSNRRSDRRSPGSSAAPWRCRRPWSSGSRFRGTDAPPPRESVLVCRVRYVRKPASCRCSIGALNVQLFRGLSKRKCGLGCA